MIYTITFVWIDNTNNDSKYNFPITIRYKGSCNNESNKFTLKDLIKYTYLIISLSFITRLLRNMLKYLFIP